MNNFEYALRGMGLEKRYKGFTLNIPELLIPKGMATALIGENGAGKTTLLNMLAGIRMDYRGELYYFEECGSMQQDPQGDLDRCKERIGYTGTGKYFMPNWKLEQVEEVGSILFDRFDRQSFRQWCGRLSLSGQEKKRIKDLSDGMRTKLMLAGALARETELLILDEPASPLDPLMRDQLCEILREYLAEGNGEKSVFFSTHNISDMEYVTDYAMIMEHGELVEEGYVDDLKEKYILVKGDAADTARAEGILYTISKSPYGFEGICLAENLDRLAGMNVTREIPTLYQISVAVMKVHSRMGNSKGAIA